MINLNQRILSEIRIGSDLVRIYEKNPVHCIYGPYGGEKVGWRKALDEEKTKPLFQLYDYTDADCRKKYTVKEICEIMAISKSTLYPYLDQRKM